MDVFEVCPQLGRAAFEMMDVLAPFNHPISSIVQRVLSYTWICTSFELPRPCIVFTIPGYTYSQNPAPAPSQIVSDLNLSVIEWQCSCSAAPARSLGSLLSIALWERCCSNTGSRLQQCQDLLLQVSYGSSEASFGSLVPSEWSVHVSRRERRAICGNGQGAAQDVDLSTSVQLGLCRSDRLEGKCHPRRAPTKHARHDSYNTTVAVTCKIMLGGRIPPKLLASFAGVIASIPDNIAPLLVRGASILARGSACLLVRESIENPPHVIEVVEETRDAISPRSSCTLLQPVVAVTSLLNRLTG